MEIQKVAGYNRIYQAECFPNEVKDMFGKNIGEMRRYLKWLYAWLHVLDKAGLDALNFEQFEHLKVTERPHLYAIRHPHSVINERYLYVYIDDESVILLTAFMEKDAKDYLAAIKHAQNIYSELEV
ncbi:MAG: hypothetical protein FWC60_11500 [Firmicutes bacterium]|nr:hypothetical protein [Bacillota bacterium]